MEGKALTKDKRRHSTTGQPDDRKECWAARQPPSCSSGLTANVCPEYLQISSQQMFVLSFPVYHMIKAGLGDL